MKNTLRIFLFIIAFFSCVSAAFAVRFRVTDEYVTVFAEPERITRLGRVHRGEVYESEGMDGSLYIFRFNGRKAYVASYCCKPVEDETESVGAKASSAVTVAKHGGVKAKPVEVKAREASAADAAPQVAVQETIGQKEETPNYFKWLDDWERKRNANSGKQMPRQVALIFGFILLIGMAVGIWTLFGTQSFCDFIDSLAGRNVTWCSKATYFRPLILVFGGGLVFYVTQNINIAFIAAGIYEIILLSLRAKKLGGLRPAIVEALYLFFYGMGTLLFCWMYLIFLLLGSGGSSRGSNGKDVNRCCGRCAYYVRDIPSDRCRIHSHSVHPSDSCGSFKPN